MRDILGEAFLGEISGQDIGQFDYGGLVKGVVNMAQTGVTQYQGDKAKDKAAHDQQAALSQALAADSEWANAEANLELSVGDPTAHAAAQVMVSQKHSDAQAAGAVLTAESMQKRCQTARANADAAANASASAPKDIAKQAKHHAWQKVSDACGQAAPADDGKVGKHHDEAPSGGGFLALITTKKAGLPVWGWGLVAIGGATALTLIVRSMKGRK